jgi:hypothetical protein
MPPRVNTGGVWISGVDAGAAVFAPPCVDVADEAVAAVDVVDDVAVHPALLVRWRLRAAWAWASDGWRSLVQPHSQVAQWRPSMPVRMTVRDALGWGGIR